jgi:hypothetical protein
MQGSRGIRAASDGTRILQADGVQQVQPRINVQMYIYMCIKPGSVLCRDQEAYEQLQMERGYCSLTGSNKYSPQLLRDRVASSPAAVGQLVLRGARMVTSLGTFFGSLALDDIMGRADDMELVALRAAQLRFDSWPCCSASSPTFFVPFFFRGVRMMRSFGTFFGALQGAL